MKRNHHCNVCAIELHSKSDEKDTKIKVKVYKQQNDRL